MTAGYPKVKSCIVPLDLKQAMTKDYAHLVDADKQCVPFI
jgi:hypothetical protein